MGSKFFSHRTPSRTGEVAGEVRASEIALEGRDRQQALVLDALRRAAGAPVSYAELRGAGVELPASVVSELELAGVAIERCYGAERGVVGVRLDPANEPAARPTPEPAERAVPTATEPDSEWSSVRMHRASSLEGLVLSILAWLAPPTRKAIRSQRHRTMRRGRATAARTAMATGMSEAPVTRKPFRVEPRETCRGRVGGAGRNCTRVLGRRDLDRGRWPSSASVNLAATPPTSCCRGQRFAPAQRPQAHASAGAGAGVACPRYRARSPGA